MKMENREGFPFENDFLRMKGSLIKHPIQFSSELLSNNEILELQENNGLTIWFARFFYKDICISGSCRMAKFWIFWDGTGNYLGYRLNENNPLTKSDHVDFQPDDYLKLHNILADTVSILKNLKYADLAIEVDDKNNEEKSILNVDAFTQATPPALSKYVVKDAVFTCYTLWQTVYGETKIAIDEMLEKRVDSGYMSKLFNGSNVQKLFALEIAARNSLIFQEYEARILRMITSEEKELSEKSLTVIPSLYLQSTENQIKLVELLNESLSQTRYEIIYKLQKLEHVSPKATILLLDRFDTEKHSVGELNQILRIISKQMIQYSNVEKELIRKNLSELMNSPNPYITKIIKSFLE